jgi:hypothetical protein
MYRILGIVPRYRDRNVEIWDSEKLRLRFNPEKLQPIGSGPAVEPSLQTICR